MYCLNIFSYIHAKNVDDRVRLNSFRTSSDFWELLIKDAKTFFRVYICSTCTFKSKYQNLILSLVKKRIIYFYTS